MKGSEQRRTSRPENGKDDRYDVRLWRSRPYECLRGGINPQVVWSAGLAERLRKPTGEKRQAWKSVRHAPIVMALKGRKPREYLDIQSSKSLHRNPEVG